MQTDSELAGDQIGPFKRALSSSHMRMRHRCIAIAIVGMATVINGGTLAVAQAVPRSAQSSQSRNQGVPLLNKASRKDVVESLADELISRYVHADVGMQLAETIRNKLKSKAYDHIDSVDQFATILTQDLYAVAHDKHLRVTFSRESNPENPGKGQLAEVTTQLAKSNALIAKLEILPGNVGYLQANGVPAIQYSKDAIAAAFAFLQRTDALIIDLRGNGGGDPHTVSLYMSYLSEGPSYVVNTFHQRENGRVEEFWTTDMGSLSYGNKKPLYVLTSKRTFSGGEEFAYDVQAFRRGIVVGETTGGGANPGGNVSLKHQFAAFIPTGYPVNPVTGGNWEGVGVKPDVEVSAAQALLKAQYLAVKRLSATASDQKTRDSLDSLALKLNAEISSTKSAQ